MKTQSLQDLLTGLTPQTEMMEISIEDIPDDFADTTSYDSQTQEPDFNENLAEFLDENMLDSMASELLDDISGDIEAREPWMDMIAKVKEQIGISDMSSYEEPFPGASSVTYPIIIKAQIQFQARALPEIFPNNPAKSVVIGVSNPMLEQKAERIADVINYQIQYQDKGNRKDFSKMLWWLPLTGSTFRYVYHDPIRDINMARFVPVDDFIVPYGTTSLEDAIRFTHRFVDTKNDMMKLQRMGYYLECPLTETDNLDDDQNNPVQELRDEGDGKHPSSEFIGKSAMQECYNVYCNWDLEGYEDKDDDDEDTGIALPYVVTIHVPSKKILAIRRNWKENDPLKLRRIYYSHYKYQEGPGFYGSGLPHLIGSIQEATTGALRAFGDALAFALLPAGWKSEDAKFSGTAVFSPGSFQDVSMTVDDINKAIKVANFPAPPGEALEYIKMLDREAQTIVSIQDIMTGDTSPQNAPVGTTLAMIEQASKIITAQHKSLYESFSDELSILADLNYDFLPDNDNFSMPGKVTVVQRSDFDGAIDVQPTADPSVSSFQMRQAIDQATMQIAQIPEFKPFFRDAGYPLCRRILDNLNVPSLDEIMIAPEEYQQLKAQAQQNPPPPSPDQIKVQVMQAEAQSNAQQAQMQMQIDAQKSQAETQLKSQQMQLDMQKMQVDAENAQTALKLQEKQMDMKNASENKMIDARFIGTVAPHLMQLSDELATQQDDKYVQTSESQQDAVSAQPVSSTALAAPVNPEKQNMLIRLMNKIRGK